MSGVRTVLAVLIALLLPVLGASCSADGGTEPPDDSLAGVSVELLQYRRDEADRRIEVKVDNPTDRTVTIDRIELRAPGFEGTGAVDQDAVVPAGQRLDLRVPYGEPSCGTTTSGRPSASVLLWSASGESAKLTPTAGTDVLPRIHERECATKDVLEAAPLAWAPTWQPEADVVHGALLVGSVARSRTARIVELEGTTLFAVSATDLPIALEAGGTASVPVEITPARCDPHAVGESKRGYAFGVRVIVDGGPSDGVSAGGVLVTVNPDEPGRRILESMLLKHCGLD